MNFLEFDCEEINGRLVQMILQFFWHRSAQDLTVDNLSLHIHIELNRIEQV